MDQWPADHRVSCEPSAAPARYAQAQLGRIGKDGVTPWSVHALVQAIILGVLTGGVYALMASGQTLIFGIMRVVNLAQAALVVLAAYLSFSLFKLVGIDPFLSILITTPILFAIGVVVQWSFLRVLRADDAAQLSLLVTFAIALGIEGLLALVYNTPF